MNDFTLEELERLKLVIENDLEKYDSNELELLLVKIQTMIDKFENLCAHEFERELIKIDLCNKCKCFKFVFSSPQNE